MQKIVALMVIALAFAGCSGSSSDKDDGGSGGVTAPKDNGDFTLTYSNEATWADWLQQWQMLEDDIAILNEVFALPHDIDVYVEPCGEANAFYDPETRSVIMCDELMDWIVEVGMEAYPNMGELQSELYIYNVTEFIFFHEVGHAFVDAFEIPITGAEEDAVDALSTLVLIWLYEDPADAWAILDAADFWGLVASDDEVTWGEHSLSEQRMYNILCMVYGSNTTANEWIVEEGWLPEDRAFRCEDEFMQKENSWDTLLSPYVKDI